MTNKDLQVGDYAMTDFNSTLHKKVFTKVRITERIENVQSQSRVCYRVEPLLHNGNSKSIYDAAWFVPIEKEPIQHHPV